MKEPRAATGNRQHALPDGMENIKFENIADARLQAEKTRFSIFEPGPRIGESRNAVLVLKNLYGGG
jgi:hypothetical protein